jgi:hypothetical protein
LTREDILPKTLEITIYESVTLAKPGIPLKSSLCRYKLRRK